MIRGLAAGVSLLKNVSVRATFLFIVGALRMDLHKLLEMSVRGRILSFSSPAGKLKSRWKASGRKTMMNSSAGA